MTASWSYVRLIAETLADSTIAADPIGRAMLAEELDAMLGKLEVRGGLEHGGGRRQEIYSLVSLVSKHEGGLLALVEAVAMFDPAAGRRLRALVPRPLLQAAERSVLIDLLSALPDADLGRAYRAVSGLPAVPLRTMQNASAILAVLEDTIANPDGVPPLLVFLAGIATLTDNATAAQIRHLIGRVGDRERVVPEALARLAAVAPPTHPATVYLQIEVHPDALEPDHALVRARLATGDGTLMMLQSYDEPVRIDGLSSLMGALIAMTEQAAPDSSPTIEFFLPVAWLHLAVDRLPVDDQPLGVRYPVVVRYLERLDDLRLQRQWQDRWRRLTATPAGSVPHWIDDAPHQDGGPDGWRLQHRLRNDEIVCAAITAGPNASRRRDDLLRAALYAGVPAMVWSRNGGDPATVRAVIGGLVAQGGLMSLPRTVHGHRVAGGAVADDLVLLFDDPGRIPKNYMLRAPTEVRP